MLFLALLGLSSSPIFAAEVQNHDRARDLYAHGDIRSLDEVLRAVRQSTESDVVDIDLVQRDGAWIYRIEIVAPDGRRKTVEIPAAKDDGDDDGGGSAGQ
jgi:uncharacterized membrane protein YkoI